MHRLSKFMNYFGEHLEPRNTPSCQPTYMISNTAKKAIPLPLSAPRHRYQTMMWVGQAMEAEDRRVAAERARALLCVADEERSSY